jgi:hypothetical protein
MTALRPYLLPAFGIRSASTTTACRPYEGGQSHFGRLK